jgi:hypothetical protein
VTVVAVDHRQAGAHVATEVEGGHAGTKRERREAVTEIVDPTDGVDPERALRRLPVAVAEVVQVEVILLINELSLRHSGKLDERETS